MFKYQRRPEWRDLYKSTPVLAYSESSLYMPFASDGNLLCPIRDWQKWRKVKRSSQVQTVWCKRTGFKIWTAKTTCDGSGRSPKPKRNTSSIFVFVKWSGAWFINKHSVWKFTSWCLPCISATRLWSTQHNIFDKLPRGDYSSRQFSTQMSWISWHSTCWCGTLWFKL